MILLSEASLFNTFKKKGKTYFVSEYTIANGILFIKSVPKKVYVIFRFTQVVRI